MTMSFNDRETEHMRRVASKKKVYEGESYPYLDTSGDDRVELGATMHI